MAADIQLLQACSPTAVFSIEPPKMDHCVFLGNPNVCNREVDEPGFEQLSENGAGPSGTWEHHMKVSRSSLSITTRIANCRGSNIQHRT